MHPSTKGDLCKKPLYLVDALQKEINGADAGLNDLSQKKKILRQEIEDISSEISKRESDLRILANVEEKKNQIKIFQDKIESLKTEIH